MFFSAEFIPIVLSPLVLLGALIALSLLFKKRVIGLTALAALWLLSLPIVADSIWRSLEGDHRLINPQSAPSAEVIVVLGGMTSLAAAEDGYAWQWEEGSDRFWAGVNLFQAAKAPHLVFTGGRQPWSPVKETEGQWLALQAERVGVPKKQILVSGEARNTAQEAKAVAALISKRNILLVTSVFHMPRAQKIFQDAGFQVAPFAVDFRVRANPTRWSDFLPSSQALRKSSEAIREWIGRWFYGV